jgi:DhnA family fructose-bisphosphate aldolase class Ia
MDTERAALEIVHGAMLGGAQGVVFGRNIWQSKNVSRAISALRAIIHSAASVDQAMQEYES